MCHLRVKAVSLNTTVIEDESTLSAGLSQLGVCSNSMCVPLCRYANSYQAQACSLHCGRDGSEKGWTLAHAEHEVSWWH